MNKPNRKDVTDSNLQPVGRFAVMRHSSKLKRAHFSAIHDTYESACNEAVRLVASTAAAQPELQHHYYVVEIGARFSAGIEGLHCQERPA